VSKVKVEPPGDDLGRWMYSLVTGTEEPIEIEIPGTGAVEDVQSRFAAIFELFELLKEMNQNMVNIDDGIKELNENIKELGLAGLGGDLDE
jgi:hypothetical protein